MAGKKQNILLTVTAVIFIIGILAAVFLFSINPIIEKAVNTVGPKITGAPVTLGSSDISFLSGEGELRDLKIGNPKGFKTPEAISVASIRIAIDPTSLKADTIRIPEITVKAPVITYELLSGRNNITALRNNIRKNAAKFSAGEPASEPGNAQNESAGKKIIIDHFLIQDAKIVLAIPGTEGKTMEIPLPNIELNDLGKENPEKGFGGIAEQVFNRITTGVVQTATSIPVDELKKQAQGAMDDISTKVKSLFD